MLPTYLNEPNDYIRFVKGRSRYIGHMRRERDKRLLHLAELLKLPEWHEATDEVLAAELGVTRKTIIEYKNILVERGRCKHCGQTLPAVSPLQKDTP